MMYIQSDFVQIKTVSETTPLRPWEQGARVKRRAELDGDGIEGKAKKILKGESLMLERLPLLELPQNSFITAAEVEEDLGISRSSAYTLIRHMNNRLEKMGHLTIRGRVDKNYYLEQMHPRILCGISGDYVDNFKNNEQTR